MSPTLSDDTLVRELTERADHAVPAMSLDPVGVLAAGRRHRRRQTVLRSVAGLAAVAAVAVGAAQLWPGQSAVPPVGPSDPAFDLGIEVEIPEDAAVISTDIGTVVDTGLNLYGLEYENPADATRLVLAQTPFPPEAPTTVGVQVLALSPEGTAVPKAAYGLADLTETPDAWWGAGGTGGNVMYIMGVAPLGLEEGEGAVVVSPGTADEPIRFPLRMIAVPGFDREVFLAVIRDAPGSDAAWPTMVVQWVGTDGTVMTTPTLDGGSGDTESVEAEVADSGLTIQVAEDVRPVETDDGPAFDLGVQVGDEWDPLDQGLTYALRAGDLVDGDSRTPDEPGLWLVTLAQDGSTVTGAGGSVDEALAPAHRNPIWSAGLTDHEVYVVGVRPPALDGATFDLIIERDTGKQVVPIPTFRVPGLDADVWFVALTDPDADVRDWPTTAIRVTNRDGTTASWSLAGVAQTTS